MIRLTALFVACAPAWAQIGAPPLGYVADAGRLRPVFGIPSAGAVLAPIDYGRSFAQIAPAPRQDYAIASDASTGEVLLLTSSGAISLAGARSAPDSIALSPSGTAAVLWFAAANRLQIFSNLPAAPAARDVDLSFLTEAPDALAVADDGSLAVGAWRDGLYSFGSHGELAKLPVYERVYALAFYAGSHDLAAATRRHIFTLSGQSAASVYEGALRPAGIALASNNHRIVIADFSGALLNLNLYDKSVSFSDCGCAVEGVFPMGPSLFRISRFDGASFKLFDASAGEVYFVALPASERGGEQ